MVLEEVKNCPDTFLKWKLNSKRCSNTEHYHCVLNENSKFVDGCIRPIWIEPEFCPVYNTLASKMDSQKCKDAECPTSTFRSFQIYQYPECLSRGIASLDTTSVGNTYSYTTNTSTTTGSSSSPVSIILPSVLVAFVLLSIAIAVIYIKCKKNNRKENYSNIWNCCQTNSPKEKPTYIRVRNYLSNCLPSNRAGNTEEKDVEDEESTLVNRKEDTSVQNEEKKLKIKAFLNSMNATTDELYEDSERIQKFLDILKKEHRVAFIGERGSGKKSFAMQLARKLEAEQNELQYKVLHDFHSCEFTIPVFSTIIVIPELFKTWYTHTHVQNVMKRLELMCPVLKQNKCYIIATFIKSTWYSFTEICSQALDVFPNPSCDFDILEFSKPIASYIAEKHGEIFSDEFSRYLNKDAFGCIGKPLRALFYCKFSLCKEKKFFLKPLEAIMLELKLLHKSRCFDYHILLYIMLHNGCIEKEKLLKDTKHILFDEILRKVEDENFFQSRVNNLLTTYLVNSVDGKYYRIIHDVIVRCLCIASVNDEHFDLLFRECDPNLLLDCIRVKTVIEKIHRTGECIVDFKALKIGISTEMFSIMAETLKKREDILEVSNIANVFKAKEYGIRGVHLNKKH